MPTIIICKNCTGLYIFCFIRSRGLLDQMKIDKNNISALNNWKMYTRFVRKLFEPGKK